MNKEVKIEGFSAYHVDSGEKIELAMQDLRLEGTITEIGAILNIRHIFRSAEETKVEAIYAFMLPRDAALRRFKIVGEGFSVSSSLMKTSEAKDTYEEGIKNGSLSVLTQQYRDGVVNLSIGNLRPDETVAVYLEVLAGVDLHDDGFRFRFPFTLAPGYHSKARYSSDGGVGEVSLPEDEFGDVIYPDWWKDASNLHTVSFSLDVAPKNIVMGVSSPSHPLDIHFGDNNIQISLATEKDVPNRDLILDAFIDSIDPRIFYASNQDEDDRFVAVIPSKCFNKVEETPRRMVFVIDRSGSMRGTPMTQAKRALKACLGALSAEDSFGIVSFDNRVELFKESLVYGRLSNREAASIFIQGIEARGGTELLVGIKSAIDILDAKGDIIVITDGQVLATEEIINQIVHEGVRIHCLGIGSASQDRFLTLLSRKTRGISSFVSPRERVDLAALKLFSSIKSPAAEEVKIRIIENEGKINPPPLTTVYQGVPLIIYGTSNGKCALSVNWKNSVKDLEIPLSIDKNLSYEILKLIHGARIITDLDSQIFIRNRKNKNYNKRLEIKLLEASMEYGLASRAASLVAVVKRKDDISGDIPLTKVVPVGIPEDVQFDSYMKPVSISSAINRLGAVDKLNALFEKVGTSPIGKVPEALLRNDTVPNRRDEELDESDMLFEIVSMMQPDGGMPGENDEERVLYSLLMLLEITQQPQEVAEAFEIHLNRLLKFVDIKKTQLTPNKIVTIEHVLDQVNQGKIYQGTWIKYLSNLVKKTPLTNTTEIWKLLD